MAMIYHGDTKTLGVVTAGGVIASLFVPVFAPAIATAAILTCVSAANDGKQAWDKAKAEAEPEPEPMPKRKVSTDYNDSPLAIYQRRAAENEKAKRSIGFHVE